MKCKYGKASKTNRKRGAAPLPNEDRASIHEELGMAAIFDGHGGALCAEFLNEHAIPNLTESLKTHAIIGDHDNESGLKSEIDSFPAIAKGFMEAFGTLEEQFKTVYEETGSTSGACALMAFIHGDKLYTGHCGDVRAIYAPLNMSSKKKLFSKRSQGAVQLTEDHRVNEPGEERQRVEEEGGIIYRGRVVGTPEGATLSPSRTFGDWDIKAGLGKDVVTALPDVNVVPINTELLVILATDGVFDALSNDKAIEVVRTALKSNPNDLDTAAQYLVDTASKSSRDDCTAVIIAIEP